VDERKLLTQLAAELADALRPLVSQVQSIAVLGNHDYRMGAPVIREMLAELGIQELDNDVLTLQRGGDVFHFAGVDDPWNGYPRLRRVTSLLPENGAAVLLAHEPDYADISAAVGRFDLQISGHSHGGQVVPPGLGPLVLPYMGRKYPAGLYQVGKMLQYTNRGLGMTAPYLRLNCRPEITLFTFKTGEIAQSHDPYPGSALARQAG
jgi:predicted MPP superfamily phosphohydrolase